VNDFEVSLGWAKKTSAARTRTGQIDRPPWRRGPASKVTATVQEGAAGADSSEAGCDPAGVAGATGTSQGRDLEHKTAVAGFETDGAAA
jgi:hypothetical protein